MERLEAQMTAIAGSLYTDKQYSSRTDSPSVPLPRLNRNRDSRLVALHPLKLQALPPAQRRADTLQISFRPPFEIDKPPGFGEVQPLHTIKRRARKLSADARQTIQIHCIWRKYIGANKILPRARSKQAGSKPKPSRLSRQA